MNYNCLPCFKLVLLRTCDSTGFATSWVPQGHEQSDNPSVRGVQCRHLPMMLIASFLRASCCMCFRNVSLPRTAKIRGALRPSLVITAKTPSCGMAAAAAAAAVSACPLAGGV